MSGELYKREVQTFGYKLAKARQKAEMTEMALAGKANEVLEASFTITANDIGKWEASHSIPTEEQRVILVDVLMEEQGKKRGARYTAAEREEMHVSFKKAAEAWSTGKEREESEFSRLLRVNRLFTGMTEAQIAWRMEGSALSWENTFNLEKGDELPTREQVRALVKVIGEENALTPEQKKDIYDAAEPLFTRHTFAQETKDIARGFTLSTQREAVICLYEALTHMLEECGAAVEDIENIKKLQIKKTVDSLIKEQSEEVKCQIQKLRDNLVLARKEYYNTRAEEFRSTIMKKRKIKEEDLSKEGKKILSPSNDINDSIITQYLNGNKAITLAHKKKFIAAVGEEMKEVIDVYNAEVKSHEQAVGEILSNSQQKKQTSQIAR